MFSSSPAPSPIMITPVRPAAHPDEDLAASKPAGLLRRTLPSRRTLGRGNYSRRTFGKGTYSRRTFGRGTYSRRTFGKSNYSRRTFGVGHP